MIGSKFTMMALAALLAVPPAFAGWSAMGTHEPDTLQDQTEGWMTLEPDRSVGRNVVYFNGFQGQYPLTAVNPNSGAAQTSMGSFVWKDFAILGVWRDCNGDGYVGLGDQGVFDYRAELLVGPLDLDICHVETVPTPIPVDWMPVHNDGIWVREFFPIGWKAWDNDPYFFDINDNASRVWVDDGLPTDDLSGGQRCWINQQPRDTYHSTGGVVEWLDCHTGWKATLVIDALASSHPLLAPLSFEDAPTDQSNSHSVLNVRNPWGTEDEASAAQAWDCSQGQLARVRDPTAPEGGSGVLRGPGTIEDPTGEVGDTDVYFTSADGRFGGLYLNVSAPSLSPQPDPSGSPAGTANATAAGLDRCERRSDGPGTTASDVANAPYSNEGDVVNSAAKIDTFPFSYNSITGALGDLGRIETYTGLGVKSVDDVTKPQLDRTLGGQETIFLGVQQGGAFANGFWYETPNRVGPEVVPGSSSSETFYAYVSPAAVLKYGLTLPNGAKVGSYGAETCGTHTSGVYSGWDCDKDHWYRDASGNDVHDTDSALGPCHEGQDRCDTNAACNVGSLGCVSIAIYPGDPYNLRDVDCYDDANVATRALHVSLVELHNIVLAPERDCSWPAG